MNNAKFFEEQTDSSRIKANIVAEYFPKYARILLNKPQPEIRYLDLFAGPGIYNDQNLSTPLLLAQTCANDSILKTKVRLLFNDKEFSETLKSNFLAKFPDGTFAFEPIFGDKTVGENEQIENYLSKEAVGRNPHPTLLFFDPWGYKTINTSTLAKFLGHWGNEIFLFVNIKRIHAAIVNNKFDELMQSLFPTTIEKLRHDRKYQAISVHERLSLIMDNLAIEFKNAVQGTLFHCAFKFQEEDSNTTSHFIIHFTKHAKGYELVKQIYYDFDNIGAVLEKDGVYTFDAKQMDKVQDTSALFGDLNIESLSKDLKEKYAGKIISAEDLFNEHHTSGLYCKSHYAKTLRNMVDKGLLSATFTDNSIHMVSVLINRNCKLKFNP